MKPVTVDKEQLLDTLRENRERHINSFEEVLEAYRNRAVELLEEHISRIRNGAVERVVVSLPPPQNYEEEYDRAIAMLEWSQDEKIELNAQDFDRYVRDEWDWKGDFNQTAATYMTS